MTISRNFSVMAQGASTAGILGGTYGGTGGNILPTTAGNVLFTADGSVWSSTAKIVRGTSQATTSGTSIDFTGIPSWVKRITIMFNGVSTNGTSNLLLQIGSGSVTATGYGGSSTATGTTSASASFTTGFGIYNNNGASNVIQGSVQILSTGSNIWVASGVVGNSNFAASAVMGGSVTLSGALDRVRLTTVNGTDTFDAGSVNILYE